MGQSIFSREAVARRLIVAQRHWPEAFGKADLKAMMATKQVAKDAGSADGGDRGQEECVDHAAACSGRRRGRTPAASSSSVALAGSVTN
jgi:hypothetical protein